MNDQAELLTLFSGDELRATMCAEWLERIGRWAGSRSNYRAALACEVVRGIVDVTSTEWTAGVRWAGGEPLAGDWVRALELYGPTTDRMTAAGRGDRSARAYGLVKAVEDGDNRAARLLVTA